MNRLALLLSALLLSALLLSACNTSPDSGNVAAPNDSNDSPASDDAKPDDAKPDDTPDNTSPDETPDNTGVSYRGNYYDNLTSSTHAATLKAALHTLIDGHRALTYTQSGNNWRDCWDGSVNDSSYWQRCTIDVWESLNYTDASCEAKDVYCDSVVLLYSGDVRPTSMANRGSGGNDSWDREHVWPKSRGFPNKSQDGYTDLHHLRPADRNINSTHSNYGFNDSANNGGSPYSETTLSGEGVTVYVDSTNNSFEPTERAKGQVARMLFYMAVRYEEGDDGGSERMPDLQLIKGNRRVSEPVIGDLCALLDWHKAYPVTAFEMRRNNRIEQIQNNRNPFIDHPEYADAIWGDECR